MRDIFAPLAKCLASASSFFKMASGMRIFGASAIVFAIEAKMGPHWVGCQVH
jgi:hypothetical protein